MFLNLQLLLQQLLEISKKKKLIRHLEAKGKQLRLRGLCEHQLVVTPRRHQIAAVMSKPAPLYLTLRGEAEELPCQVGGHFSFTVYVTQPKPFLLVR